MCVPKFPPILDKIGCVFLVLLWIVFESAWCPVIPAPLDWLSTAVLLRTLVFELLYNFFIKRVAILWTYKWYSPVTSERPFGAFLVGTQRLFDATNPTMLAELSTFIGRCTVIFRYSTIISILMMACACAFFIASLAYNTYCVTAAETYIINIPIQQTLEVINQNLSVTGTSLSNYPFNPRLL